MSAEILTMFNFVQLSKPSNKSVTHILENISNMKGTTYDTERMLKLVHVSEKLETIYDAKGESNMIVAENAISGDGKDTSMSLRQLKRIWQSSYGLSDFEVGDLIQRNLLTKVMNLHAILH